MQFMVLLQYFRSLQRCIQIDFRILKKMTTLDGLIQILAVVAILNAYKKNGQKRRENRR